MPGSLGVLGMPGWAAHMFLHTTDGLAHVNHTPFAQMAIILEILLI